MSHFFYFSPNIISLNKVELVVKKQLEYDIPKIYIIQLEKKKLSEISLKINFKTVCSRFSKFDSSFILKHLP